LKLHHICTCKFVVKSKKLLNWIKDKKQIVPIAKTFTINNQLIKIKLLTLIETLNKKNKMDEEILAFLKRDKTLKNILLLIKAQLYFVQLYAPMGIIHIFATQQKIIMPSIFFVKKLIQLSIYYIYIIIITYFGW